jgi:hypothetical protein
VNVAAIPAELRALDQWVVWRAVVREGRTTKIPYRADGAGRASSTDPTTWGTFDAAVTGAEALNADGIGFVFTADDPYAGVDLDQGLSEVDRMAIVLALDSYAEISPSGNGVHVILRASLNDHGRNRKGPFEVYERGRYFTVTGDHLRGTPATVEERQAQLEDVLARFLPTPEPKFSNAEKSAPIDLDDRALLDKAMDASNGARFQRLWNGDTGGYGSQSEADQALVSMLAFWAGDDPDRIDRLFRQSGLYREKWERVDYREKTIAKVLGGEVYNPSSSLLSRNVGGTPKEAQPLYSSERGVPTDIPGKQACGLGAVLDAFAELLVMPDPGSVEIALAAIVANYAPGDAVWPLLVGPPGCGKSEIVTALTSAPAVWPLSSLTPQTLLSGFERKGKDKGPPASMLLQIGSFGILAFKDLTTVLTMHREARAQIIGQLREVADGKTEKSFGNGLRIEWEGKLGLIAGVTPVIDEQHAFLAVMGERFVLYRLPEVPRREIAVRSLQRRGHELELRDRIRTTVAEFLAGFRSVDRLELPERFTEPLVRLADIVTRARSGVARDYQTRDILYLPEPEAPTRLAKQIAQLMAAALTIGVDETEAWRLARKVGWDPVPAVRVAVIRLLSRQDGNELTFADLEEKTGLPSTTVRRVVEDLVVLGLVDQRKETAAQNSRWLVRESLTASDYWDSEESS